MPVAGGGGTMLFGMLSAVEAVAPHVFMLSSGGRLCGIVFCSTLGRPCRRSMSVKGMHGAMGFHNMVWKYKQAVEKREILWNMFKCFRNIWEMV